MMELGEVGGVIFREAQLSDYQGVVDLQPNTQAGADYLPWFYKVACHNKRSHLFVAEENGEIVSRCRCWLPIYVGMLLSSPPIHLQCFFYNIIPIK